MTWAPRSPAHRFGLTFGVLAVAGYCALATPFVQGTVFPAYLRWTARMAAAAASHLGLRAEALGQGVFATGFAVEVRRGCDAIEPSVLFAIAVLASPVAWRLQLRGLLLGIAVLQMLNLVRIVSLLQIGLHWPAGFHFMHVEVWQPLFIVFAVALWICWGVWAIRRHPDSPPTAWAAARRLVQRPEGG